MEYGEVQGFGKRFQISKNVTDQSLDDLQDVLAYTFHLRRSMQNSEKTVPDAEHNFLHNLQITVQKMLEN